MSWFRIHFVENEGMAWGWKWGGEWGKVALTLFRLVAVIAGVFIIRGFIQKNIIGALFTVQVSSSPVLLVILSIVFFTALSFLIVILTCKMWRSCFLLMGAMQACFTVRSWICFIFLLSPMPTSRHGFHFGVEKSSSFSVQSSIQPTLLYPQELLLSSFSKTSSSRRKRRSKELLQKQTRRLTITYRSFDYLFIFHQPQEKVLFFHFLYMSYFALM